MKSRKKAGLLLWSRSRDDLSLGEIIAVAFFEGDPLLFIGGVLFPGLGIVNEDHALIFSDDAELVALHDDGHVFIDSDPEELGAIELLSHFFFSGLRELSRDPSRVLGR